LLGAGDAISAPLFTLTRALVPSASTRFRVRVG
jgi:hypothetical protein